MKQKSIQKPKAFCPCGESATSLINAGHGLELYLCDACKNNISEGVPVKITCSALNLSSPGVSNSY